MGSRFRESSFGLVVALAGAGAAPAAASASAAPAPPCNNWAAPPSTGELEKGAEIPFEHVVRGKLAFTVPDHKAKTETHLVVSKSTIGGGQIWKLSGPEALGTLGCVAKIGAGGQVVFEEASRSEAKCVELFDPVPGGSLHAYVWSRKDFVTMTIEKPVGSGKISTKKDLTETPKLPIWLAKGSPFYMRSGPDWFTPEPTGCWDPGKGDVPLPDDLWRRVRAELAATKKAVPLYARKPNGQLVSLTVEPPPKEPTKPDPGDKFVLATECGKQLDLLGAPKQWMYLMCVDLEHRDSPIFDVRTTTVGADPDAGTAQHFFAGRKIRVAVWSCDDVAPVTIDLSGTKSVEVRALMNRAKDSVAGGTPGVKARTTPCKHRKQPVTRSFVGRAGGIVELTITSGQGDDAVPYQHEVVVEQGYRGALSFGIAASLAPFDRKYRLAAGSGTNAGHTVIIEGGEDFGIPSVDLTLGYTFFFDTLYEHREFKDNPHWGWYIGVGVATADLKGIDVITGIHTGPELLIGRDMGIALDFSMRRTKRLRGDLTVGSVLPDANLPTNPWFAFGVGILLNVSPDFFKALGALPLPK